MWRNVLNLGCIYFVWYVFIVYKWQFNGIIYYEQLSNQFCNCLNSMFKKMDETNELTWPKNTDFLDTIHFYTLFELS